MLSANIIN